MKRSAPAAQDSQPDVKPVKRSKSVKTKANKLEKDEENNGNVTNFSISEHSFPRRRSIAQLSIEGFYK